MWCEWTQIQQLRGHWRIVRFSSEELDRSSSKCSSLLTFVPCISGLFAGPTMFSDPSTLGVANVVGVTFRALKNTTFFIGRYNGIVSVRDCAFVDSSSAPNIYIEAAGRAIDRRLANSDSRQDDFVAVRNEIELFMGNEIRDAGGVHRFLQENSGVLNVTFTGCLFGNNRYATQSGINNTLFWLASVNQGTVFKNCTFQNNDYGSRVVNPLTQTLIFNNGGSLSLDTNCFTNNKVLNFGYVNSLSPLSFARNNYGTIPTNSTACEFFSVFPDGPGSPIFNPICIKFDAASCPLLNAPAPTSKPTSTPIQSPATQPVSPPAGACGIKYAPCVVNSDCCSKLCRGPIEAGVMRTCSGPNTSSKGSFKLSNGRGGAGGGASKRD
jgi:hypothetical protein